MPRFVNIIACFCLIFGVFGREWRRIDFRKDDNYYGLADGRIVAIGEEDDDEYSDDSVETFIVGQKRKYAINETSGEDFPHKRQDDSLSMEVASEFDAVYAELSGKPGTCSCNEVPAVPGDRRERKGRLRVASFNAEWLFLFGGNGSVECPGRGCPWEVKRRRDDF